MSTANPRHHDAWLPAALESGTWDAQAHHHAVQARLADLDALAEATTDPWVDRRVVIDQAVDLRRALLDQAEQARQASGSFESVPRARTARAVLAAALGASACALRPLAGALVDQADLQDVAERSVATCRRCLLLTDHVFTTAHTISRRR